MSAIVSAGHMPPMRFARIGGRLLLLSVLACTLGGCAWLEMRQSQIALRPTPGRPAGVPPDAQPFRPGDERRAVAVGQEQLAIWWLPHADRTAPTLLYLHGTFRNLYSNMPKIDALRAAGFSVLAVDYRGWGDSTPIVPNEDTITADAAIAWAELQRRQPQGARRVIYGHSMGGSVATRLASTLRGARGALDARAADYGALVVESTFTRVNDVARAAGFLASVLSLFSTLDFDSIDHMRRVDGPVWMLHGDADTTVPVALGRSLRDAVPAGALARWVEIPGGNHSGLHRDETGLYQRTFSDLIKSLPAAGTAP